MKIDAPTCIQLRGVRVHNLKNVDVDIPLNQLTAITGVSGSGKSSLAFDTLFVEGQRRYIDSFSASARQHLERLEKPDVEDVSRIPPAVAIRQVSARPSLRSTVGTTTEIQRYLEMLFVRTGQLFCPECQLLVQKHDSKSILDSLKQLEFGSRIQLAFPVECESDSFEESCHELIDRGFSRAILTHTDSHSSKQTSLAELLDGEPLSPQCSLLIIVDRISAGKTDERRVIEAIETCLNSNAAECVVLTMADSTASASNDLEIEGQRWKSSTYSSSYSCSCGRRFRSPEPRDLHFLSPAGMCQSCVGAGVIAELNLEQIVSDRSQSIAHGAFAIFEGEKWAKEKERFLAFAQNQGVAVDVPVGELNAADWHLLIEGDPSDKKKHGVRAFLQRLERRIQTHELSLFIAQWQTIRQCDDCAGSRLNDIARGFRIQVGSANIEATDNRQPSFKLDVSLPEFSQFSVTYARDAIHSLNDSLLDAQRNACRYLIEELKNRLSQLQELGLGYLSLDRAMRSLSSGEARRIELAAVLGSPLVHSLFVFDEPSAGLHPSDMAAVIDTLHRLRDVGNTVVVVEHDRRFIEAADYCVDIGPLAGQSGGEVVYAGELAGLKDCEGSLTGKHLHGSPAETAATGTEATSLVTPATKWIELRDATFHHLDVPEVRFPLDCLCVVAGVSGAGKSSLVEHVLYPAVCQTLSRPCSIQDCGTWSPLETLQHINDVQFVDDAPLTRSARSNAVTWLDVFPAIRQLFAETQEAREREFTAGHFSFNSDRGGRCEKCDGAGRLEVDMQFLADVSMTCPECQGSRYRNEILEVTWRTRSIADVLAMTSAEAFSFFRGQAKIQRRLQPLKEVGLEYLTLGQSLATLSGGEAQRLKLAACMGTTKNRSLILLNEPSKGLHPNDVERLLECFSRLISNGHSLVVIEHDSDIIGAADHLINVGPGAGPLGGKLV